MKKKNIASPRISAKEGNGVCHTSSIGKDKHFLEIDKPCQFVKDQSHKLREAFTSHILTRFQAERLTGIRTSSICPFVKWQKGRNAIWSCGIHRDKYTGHLAEHLTMNRALAVEYYKDETEFLWKDLPPRGQQEIFKAIDAYLERKDLGFFVSSSLEDCDREVWLKVQDYIDVQMALIRTANGERRKSVYYDL